ncbi:MAG TPA: aminotransferase [Gammaproteobacteria bacterium]|nr:aminotransferase [Gammaproteobacteria bacterium]|tara:strand:- start:964 stop:2772 length:1809 start_codon:yes stop_codon:yes gene_type:complete
MSDALISKIRESIIGERRGIDTPFGTKPLVYADYMASGRSLEFIEDFIRRQILPLYANTHSEASFTGAQSTALREQARKIIRQAVGGSDDDQIIFCGSGATAAISKLIDILNLRLPADLSERHGLLAAIPLSQRPVVFVGPYEHHSNELPWRESIAKVHVVPLDAEGQLDISSLERLLQQHGDAPLIIGSFSAASNVTGIRTDVEGVTRLLKRYGALSFWDYAAAAPYVRIRMNDETENGFISSEANSGDFVDRLSATDSQILSETEETGSEKPVAKDAVFISPHKFIGGPGTPGLLVVKNSVMQNRVPTVIGGGTVSFVSPDGHRFLTDPQRREEGGTPDIVGAVRAGLVFKLKQEVGAYRIERMEKDHIRYALDSWQKCRGIEVLGNLKADRLAIASFRIKHGDRDLHYGFVVALLNDLFGIQARGGCSCAGPYGHALLNMGVSYSRKLEKAISEGLMILRPGWVRLNFNYFFAQETVDYLVQAVMLIAEHGWRLLPYYHYAEDSGTWSFKGAEPKLAVDLTTINFVQGEACSHDRATYPGEAIPSVLPLSDILKQAAMQLQSRHNGEVSWVDLPAQYDNLRWFVLPQELKVETCAKVAS